MSGTTTEYGLDTTLLDPAEEFDFGGTVRPIYDVAPEPEPDDPEVPYEPPPIPVAGRRLQAILCQPITHEPIGELRSFRVSRWGDVHGAPGEIVGTASVHDPVWTLAGVQRRTIRGRSVALPDLKGLEVSLCEDGAIVASGVFQQPTSVDGSGRMELRGMSPEAVWDERTLGEVEQRDFLAGRGMFPTSSLAGWTFESGLETEWNTTSPWEGTRSLRVRSTDDEAHWLYTPAVSMPGQDGAGRIAYFSAMIKCDSPYVFTGTFVYRSGAQIRANFTIQELGQVAEDNPGWQGPIPSRGMLDPVGVAHQVRGGVWVPSDGTWVDIDFARIQWETSTGSAQQTDLTRYPGLIAYVFQYAEGGSPEGIEWDVREQSGVTDNLRWKHQDDHPVGEAIRSVSERLDGPDVWITPDWVQIATKRRGMDRRDLALTGHTVRRARMTFDPGGEIDELRALTDLGSGPVRVVHGIDQPRRVGRRRIRQIVQPPMGMTYDAGRAWTRGQAEWAARTPIEAEVVVDYDEGRRFAVGDGVLAAIADGDLAWSGSVRVRSRSFDPVANECTLAVGPDPVVEL